MPILSWLTRGDDIGATKRAPYRLLEGVVDSSFGDKDSSNLLIHGDNLEALKALLPFYAGRVKCVFIDPPYNTKSAFSHYDDNLEHTQWLSMMWPRLELLRDLLSEDGSIWVSIDDNEAHYLKVILDEIFGRKNFIMNVIWQKKYTRSNDAKFFSDNHDHIILYSKNEKELKMGGIPRTEKQDKDYKNSDDDPNGPWQSMPLHAKSGNIKNFVHIFSNGVKWSPPSGTFPRFNNEKLSAMEKEGRIWFGKSGTAVPRFKKYLSEVSKEMVPTSIWLHSEVGNNSDAKRELRAVLPNAYFDTPKPESLIERILVLATQPNDLVLDSFLGCGTTAAVAHKMNRRYIGIEMGDHALTHCVPRLCKVVDGEQGGISKATGWNGGGGFRFYRLGPPVFDQHGQIHHEISFPVLAAHIWFSETGRPWHGNKRQAFLGHHDGRGYALLYNGVLGDKSVAGGNVLTSVTLNIIRKAAGADVPLIIYGKQSRLGENTLERDGVIFKQIPYDIATRD